MRRIAIMLALGLAVPSLALAAVTTQGQYRIEYAGNSIGSYSNLDSAVTSWMGANNITSAQLAVRQNGNLIVSHAYTFGASNPLITTGDIFRLASISKMLVTAAYSNLLQQGKLTGGELVYKYLGITKPLLASQTVDPRSNQIISLELAEHEAGLPGEGAGDPLVEMRDIEVQLGAEPLTQVQFAQYLYGQPLLSQPGFTQLYSNVGYLLLSMVEARAAGMTYPNYVQTSLLTPLGMTNWRLSPTNPASVSPYEVAAGDTYTGPSVYNISAGAPQEPFNFEGGDIIWELAAGPTDYVTNAESVSKFIGTYNVYGLGPRAIDYARDGCMPGASTWAESETSDIDFSLLFNGGPCLGFDSTVINSIRVALGSM